MLRHVTELVNQHLDEVAALILFGVGFTMLLLDKNLIKKIIGFSMMDSGIFDATTYDLMKVYLKDEEEDMYWSEQQLDLCKMIGKQNYLTQLLINDQALTE